MCHVDSTVQPDAPAVHGRQHLTAGADPVPYVTVTAEGADEQAPAIVLLTDIFGINPFYRHLAALLADRGYRVVIPDIFHRVGPAADISREAALARRGQLDDALALQDISAVIDDAVNGRALNGDRPFGVIGFCIGGSFALLSAAARPMQATVTYYAFPRGAAGGAVPTTEPVEVAAGIRGPVLGFWGRQDYIDASDVDVLTERLAQAPGAGEVVWYEQAGHSFLSGLIEPDHPAADAAHDSWTRTAGFFDTHVAVRSAV